jgi:hypothetical protein
LNCPVLAFPRAAGFIFLLALTGACTQKMVCPAYQSSYLYDKETLRKKFSYFNEDSTPRIFATAGGKNRYLVGEDVPYKRRLASLRTVSMVEVYPVLPDSAAIDSTEVLQTELDVADSTAVLPRRPSDDGYVISKAKEKFNYDEELYLWYFRDVLILPDVKAAISKMAGEGLPKAKASSRKSKSKSGKAKKPLFGFLSKNRNASADSTDVNAGTDTGRRSGKKAKKEKKPAPEPSPKDTRKEDDGFLP